MALDLPGKVQIAGVINQDDADVIIKAGADMLGFPLGLKDGREDLSVEEAAQIVQKTSARATAVCITYLDSSHDIAELCRQLGARWVQLHGAVSIGEVKKLKAHDPELGIIKSLIVRPEAHDALTGEVKVFEPLVDAFITDTFDPETGRTGATGKTHNWDASRVVVQSTRLPVILAGGLTHENIEDAIRAVRPAAVDAHTGVEGSEGFKSARLVSEFVRIAQATL